VIQYLIPLSQTAATKRSICLRKLVYFVDVLGYHGDFPLLGVCEVTLHELTVLIAVDVSQVESPFFEHLVSLRLDQDIFKKDVHIVEVAVNL
jgi:hypothetical protein